MIRDFISNIYLLIAFAITPIIAFFIKINGENKKIVRVVFAQLALTVMITWKYPELVNEIYKYLNMSFAITLILYILKEIRKK